MFVAAACTCTLMSYDAMFEMYGTVTEQIGAEENAIGNVVDAPELSLELLHFPPWF